MENPGDDSGWARIEGDKMVIDPLDFSENAVAHLTQAIAKLGFANSFRFRFHNGGLQMGRPRGAKLTSIYWMSLRSKKVLPLYGTVHKWDGVKSGGPCNGPNEMDKVKRCKS